MKLKQLFLKSSFTFWFLLTFLAVFLVLFIRPVFLKDTSMQFPRFVPVQETIGWDFKDRLDFSKALFLEKKSPYLDSNYYPPFVTIFFAPFIFLEYFTAYRILTIINVLCFAFITIVMPTLLSQDKKITTIHMAIIVAAFFSYGFHFEIERGQFNVIAIFFALIAVYIFHFHKKKRIWAYVLLTIATQLKIYPILFAFLFVEDWRNLKDVLTQGAIIGIMNVASLFILGPSIFLDFISSVSKHIVLPAKSSSNMSVQSFSGKLATMIPWLNEQIVSVSLLAIILICILIVFLSKSNRKFIVNPSLLLACTIGAMLIPSVSWDFKLSILAPAITYYLNCATEEFESESSARNKARRMVFLLVLSGLFLWTFFSTYTSKPKVFLLQSNFPPLFVILMMVAIRTVVKSRKEKNNHIATNE